MITSYTDQPGVELTDLPKARRLLRRDRRATQPIMRTGPFPMTLAWIDHDAPGAPAMLAAEEQMKKHDTIDRPLYVSASLHPMKSFKTIRSASLGMLVLLFCGKALEAGEIHDAARTGDADRIRTLLNADPEVVNAKDDRGWTPLLWATFDRHEEAVKLLLVNHANVNATNNFGASSLIFAVRRPSKGEVWTKEERAAQIAVVKLLLAHNVAPETQHEALRLAVATAEKEIVGLLLGNKADVNASDKNGDTPLHVAAGSGRKDMVEFLLDNKAEVNAKDNAGNTPLLKTTAFVGFTNVAELLLARGAEVNATNNVGKTALHQAVYWCNKDMVTMLLSNKANANAIDQHGWAPLHKAADIAVSNRKDAVEIVKLLLANKADVQAKDKNGLTPLHWAAGNSKDVTELLLIHKAEINAMNKDGWTALTQARYFSRNDVANLLHQHGGRDFVQEIDEAARRGDSKKVELLLKDHSDLAFSKDKYGATPLHYAGSKGVAELLLAKKAKIDAKNHEGMTPLHAAVSNGNNEVAECLRQHGGKE